MAKLDRLIEKLQSDPASFSFAETEALLPALGFKKLSKGKADDKRVYYKLNDMHIFLRKPQTQSDLHPHQADYLLQTLERKELI